MKADALSLADLRSVLGRRWLIVVFGAAYVISQVTILIILVPLGHDMARLQILGASAETCLEIYRGWEAAGVMPAYRAHFVLDDVHWVWYAALMTTLLCRLFDRHRVAKRYDWFLVLPLAAGLCDWYENHLQHVFLSTADYSMVVDPLPLLSTLASISKWSLAGACVVVITRLLLKPAKGDEVSG